MRLTPNEVGPIPSEWRICSLGEISTKMTNGFVGVAAEHYTSEKKGIRYLIGTNVRPNRITSERLTYVSTNFSSKNSKSILESGDLLTVQSGHIGVTAVVTDEFSGANCHALIITRLDKGVADPCFISQYLNSEIGQCRMKGLHVGSSIPHINTSELSAFKIPLPSLVEQQGVVRLLCLWDAAATIAEQLLDSSKKQRQAMLYQMVSGKKRLENFSKTTKRQVTSHGSIPADWRYVKVEQVASEVSLKNAGLIAAPVLSCTKHAGLVDSLDYFKKQVFSKDLSTYKVVPRNCFVYATNHIEEGSIGHQDIYDAGLVSPMYTVFKTTADVDDRYLYRLLKTEQFRQIFQATTNSSVDRRGSLRWKDFKKLHLPLPPLKEQAAIADIVDILDREIELLQKQLEALKAEKIALMQQLLTGKRRVTLPATVKPPSAKPKSAKPTAVRDRRK